MRRRYVDEYGGDSEDGLNNGDQVVLVGGDRVDVEVAYQLRTAILQARPELPDDAVVVREFTTFTELTEEMMRAEILVASRFHNLICALRLARPTVSLGYAAKSRHLMEALGLDEYSQEMEHVDAGRLVGQIRAARDDQAALRRPDPARHV